MNATFNCERILVIHDKTFKISKEPVSNVLNKSYYLIDTSTGEKFNYVKVGLFNYFATHIELHNDGLGEPMIVWMTEERFKDEVKEGDLVSEEFAEVDEAESTVKFEELILEGFENPIDVNLVSYRKNYKNDLLALKKLGSEDYLDLYLGNQESFDKVHNSRDIIVMRIGFGKFIELPLSVYVALVENKQLRHVTVEEYDKHLNSFYDNLVDLDELKRFMKDEVQENRLNIFKEKVRVMNEIIYEGKEFSFILRNRFDGREGEVTLSFDEDNKSFIYDGFNLKYEIDVGMFEMYVELGLETMEQ